jgi:hypothetical protein
MDPYLENPAFWPDFHAEFIGCLRKTLNDRLPGNYDARIGERVTLIESVEIPAKSIIPDVAVVRHESASHAAPHAASGGAATALTLEPVTLPLVFPAEVVEPYIEIRFMPDRSLVAVLELLSPTNKSGEGRNSYLDKRNAILAQDVHLIELDLLVGGGRLPLGKPLPPGDYYALVAHSQRRWKCDVYAWTVHQPLPLLPIPLKAPEPDLPINLAEVFAQAYDRGRYGRCLRYAEPPTAPLADADRKWAIEVAKQAR